MSTTKVTYSMIDGAPVNVKDFGAVGNGAVDDTVAIQAAIDFLSTGQILTFPAGNYKIVAGLTITNKTRIRLTGKGRLFLSGAASGAYLIKLVGTITDLEIDRLTLEGDGNSAYTQCAIGCNSGQTVTNTRFHDLNISNINVGISHNANLGGSWTNAWAYNNYLENILGTVPGSGYGIHLAKCYNAHVYDNTINNASRHSIYVASGFGLGAVLHNNIIKNHRKDVYDGSPRYAINVTRCSDVTISDNKFYDCYDGQIGIDPDTSSSVDVYNINVVGNTFTGRKNVVGCIWIGEQLMPTSYKAYKISVIANTFDEDATIGGSTIKILNGTDITIQSNRFRYYSVAASIPPSVEIGDTTYVSSDSHIANIDVRNNFCTADASVAGSKFAYISNQLCVGSSYYWVKDNSIVNVANEFSFETIPPTNVNSKLKFRTTLVNDFASIAGNTTFGGAYTINGIKPTSMVTIRPQSSLSSPMAINAFPHDSNVNGLYVWLCNAKTTAVDWPSQTFVINVEDI